MGYTTIFTGAFKVTPIVEIETTMRLNLWLNSRHYMRAFPKESELMDKTIFGSAGEKGQFIMPSLSLAKAQLIKRGIDPTIAPWLLYDSEDDMPVPKITGKSSDETAHLIAELCVKYNTPPGSLPSLHSDFMIVQDPQHQCSWLMWNQSEKSYKLKLWGEFLWWLLLELGYTAEGTISARGEDADDRWHMISTENSFCVYNGFGKPTYDKEAKAAMKQSEKAAKL